MNVTVRGFTGSDLIFQEILKCAEDLDDDGMMKLVISHSTRMLPYERFMIEIEFVDEAPNPHRFFRFGTDTTRMVDPLRLT